MEVLDFEERGKPEYREKNLSEQGREPTTNSTNIWCRRWDLNPRHIGGRRALSPLLHDNDNDNDNDNNNDNDNDNITCTHRVQFY